MSNNSLQYPRHWDGSRFAFFIFVSNCQIIFPTGVWGIWFFFVCACVDLWGAKLSQSTCNLASNGKLWIYSGYIHWLHIQQLLREAYKLKWFLLSTHYSFKFFSGRIQVHCKLRDNKSISNKRANVYLGANVIFPHSYQCSTNFFFL